jgi:hypothetical protein
MHLDLHLTVSYISKPSSLVVHSSCDVTIPNMAARAIVVQAVEKDRPMYTHLPCMLFL